MRILSPVRSPHLRSALAAGLLVPVGAAAALAHGVQVQLSFNPTAGTIESRQIVSTDTRPLTLTDLTRIYVMPLVVANGTTPAAHPAAQAAWYSQPSITNYPSGNGLCYQWDTTTGTGGQLAGTGWAWKNSSSLPNLAGTVFAFRFTDRLFKWDGGQFTAAAAGATQLQAFRATATTAGGAAVAASDPLYTVLYKNTSFDDAYAVAAAFATSQGIPLGQIQSVPEPTTTALIAGAAVAGLVSWRRRAARTGGDR